MPSSFSLFLTICVLVSTANPVLGSYKSIFSFGDSLADSGNSLYSGQYTPAAQLPYGETYFHQATGRASDGRLVIDFIAQSIGLPLLPPYLGKNSGKDLQQGVNFAVGGATALDVSFFDDKQIPYNTKYTLGVQLGWFKNLLPSLCNSSSDGCRKFFNTSLFVVGEIGGNDYNNPFMDGRSLTEVRTFVPKVIDAISSAIKVLINEGAVAFMVPGNLPIGCSTMYLGLYQNSKKADYDDSGCIKWLNDFSIYHNSLLQKELDVLRELYPNTNIMYADYYNAAMKFYQSPDSLGFKGGALTACCGGGLSRCCDDPSTYVNWDGVHLTEAAYKVIAIALLQDHQQSFPNTCNISEASPYKPEASDGLPPNSAGASTTFFFIWAFLILSFFRSFYR
ncbi:hypothetical protein MKW98_013862 [Papaver atlanticum]|uniref:GDSL esterase/lipase n=1 Tax=Papaver atlanticum TaxID=357466 RepID=A0AAD4XV08_9MAGN|nr:hypothetical protein MKW98_013862 [Papaver atlanticum]